MNYRNLSGFNDAGKLRIFAALSILLVYLIVLFNSSFSSIRADEIHFLTCGYNFAGTPFSFYNECYKFSSLPYIINLFLSKYGLVWGAMLYKSFLLSIWVFAFAYTGFYLLNIEKRPLMESVAIISFVFIYMISIRSVEVRPEGLGNPLLIVGSLLLLRKKSMPLLSLFTLLIVASLSLRYIPFVVMIMSAHFVSIIVESEKKHVAFLRNIHVFVIAVILSVFFVFAVLFDNTVQSYAARDDAFSLETKFLYLGLPKLQFPLLVEWLQPPASYLRVFLIVLIAQYIFKNFSRCSNHIDQSKCRLINFFCVLIMTTWLVLLISEPRPFDYVASLEMSIMFVCYMYSGMFRQYAHGRVQVSLLLLMSVLLSFVSFENYRYVKHEKIIASDEGNLFRMLRSSSIYEQLKSREIICDKYYDYKFVLSPPRRLICARNVNDKVFWAGVRVDSRDTEVIARSNKFITDVSSISSVITCDGYLNHIFCVVR